MTQDLLSDELQQVQNNCSSETEPSVAPSNTQTEDSPQNSSETDIHQASSSGESQSEDVREDGLSPEECKRMLEKSDELKQKGNTLYGEGKLEEASEMYLQALEAGEKVHSLNCICTIDTHQSDDAS